jgi:site-specific DNA-adenine methylase
MWNYYGSKSKLVDYYPRAVFNKIIEPFAGSARYSLKYFDRDIIVVDKYEAVINLWKWLQQCSKDDILKLPQLKKGDKISDFNLTEEEKTFLGFMAGVACLAPRNTVSNFAAIQFSRGNKLKKVANNLFKIKHWKFIHGCYTEINNQEATWFIDPPYQVGGQAYKYNTIDYKHLSEWAKERSGQVIVCENTKACWLDFVPLKNLHGAMSDTTEAIWTNKQPVLKSTQMEIFK